MRTKTRFNKLTAWFLTLVMLITLMPGFTLTAFAAANVWDGTTATGFASGTGSESDPYVIETGAQLAKLAADVNGGTTYADKYFKLGADLDLNGTTYNWTPIGGYHTSGQTEATAKANNFAGVFDGDNKTISNMKSDGPTSNYVYAGYRGLFGNVSGTLKNFTMSAPQLSGRQSYFGAAAAYADGAIISNITVNNPKSEQSVSAKYKGGVVGYIANGTIDNCKVVGGSLATNYSSSDCLGGIVGYATDTEISGCSVKNTTISSKSQYVGGIVGQLYYTDGTNSITSCTVEGTAINSTSSAIGGIVGYAYGNSSSVITVKLCSVTGGSVSASYYAGGIMGQSFYADIIGCCNYGSPVTATSSTGYAGGILGYFNMGKCYSCFSSATITATNYPGAIIGGNKSYYYECAYDKTLCSTNLIYSNTKGFTTEEIKAGAAACHLANTGTRTQNYHDWGQKIETDVYPVWNTGKDASLVVYGIENNDGTTTYYNAGGAGGYEQASDGYYEIANVNDWYRFARVAEKDSAAKARLVANIDFTGVTDLSGYTIKTYSGIFDGQGFTVKNINVSFTGKAFAFFTTIEKGGTVRNLKFDDVSLTLTSGSYAVVLIAQTNNGRIESISASDVTVNAYYASVYARYNYGTISKCNVTNIDLDAQYTSGGIACTNYDGAVIEYCDVTSGTVTLYNSGSYSDVYGGGIVGLGNGTIQYCSNGATVSVTGGRTVAAGGVSGYISASLSTPATYIGCSNTGNVSTTDLNTGNGADFAGGIIGNYSQGGYYNISESYNTGNISARANAAGICAFRSYGSSNVVDNCWNSGTITTTTTGTSTGAAGITGSGNAIVRNCLNVGTVVTAAYGAPIIASGSGTQPGVTKLVNSYALDGCVEGITSGTQYYGYDEKGNRIATGVSETDLANGTILALLNKGNTTTVWGQVVGVHTHPILLANNNIAKTQITIGGVTSTGDKTYDGNAYTGYTGTVTASDGYDASKITVTYEGTESSGTAYNSEQPPKNAGSYTVVFAVPSTDLVYEGELKLSYKITKVPVTDLVTPTVNAAKKGDLLSTITLDDGWVWADASISLTENGEYDVYFALTDEQINNYDYSVINGFNETEKRIERKVTITVELPKITFESCEDTSVEYTGSSIAVTGSVMLNQAALTKDTDYTVSFYAIDANGNAGDTTLESVPSTVGKYLVVIDVDNSKYSDSDYEIVGGEPTIIAGENAAALASAHDCVYIVEITPVALSVADGQTEVAYTSQPIVARPTVKNGDTVLTADTDYQMNYYTVNADGTVGEKLDSAPIEIGKYLFEIVLKGSYDNDAIGFNSGKPATITGENASALASNYDNCAILEIKKSVGGSETQTPIYFDNPIVEKFVNSEAFTITPSNVAEGAAVTYKSSAPNIATVNETTGEVTINKVGTVVITATAIKDYCADVYATYTLVVNKIPVTITADNKEITYGETYTGTATFSNGLTAEDFDGELGFTTRYKPGKDVDEYDVTPNGLTSDTYDIEFVTGTITVKEKTLTKDDFTLIVESKVYDGTSDVTISATVNSSAVVGTDNLVVEISGSFEDANASDKAKTVNYDIISLSGRGFENYVLDGTTGLTTTANISPCEVTFFVSAQTVKGYDGNAHGVEISAMANGNVFGSENYTVYYQAEGEDKTTEPVNVGEYAVSVELTDNSGNYVINTQPAATLKIETDASTELTIMGSNKNVTVGDMFTLYAQYGNNRADVIWVSSEESIATVTENGEVTILKSGDVTITATMKDENYNGLSADFVLTADKKRITLSASATELIKTYNGEVQNVTFTAGTLDLSDVTINTTYVMTTDASQTEPKNAGTYAVSYVIDDERYEGDGNFTLVINKATVTVSAEAISKEYGEEPEYKLVVTDNVNGIDADVVKAFAEFASDGAAKTANVGEYDITVTLTTESNENCNYVVSAEANGKLTVTPATLTVNVEDMSREYGAENPTELKYTITGFKNEETAEILTGSLAPVYADTIGTDVGTYEDVITAAGTLENGNYTVQIAYADGEGADLTITKIPVTASAGTARSSYLTITFDKAIEGLTKDNFSITDGTNPVDITEVTASADNKIYTLKGNFSTSVTYTVTSNLTGTTSDATHEITSEALSIKPTSGSGGGGGTGGGGSSTPTTYTVTFETNGGSEIDSVKVVNTADEPPVPTKDGYIFDGWYTDKELTKAYDFDTKVTKEITLYAKWTEVKTEESDKPGTSDTECDGTIADHCPSLNFDDLDVNAWYHLDTDYVIENGIFKGTTETTFAPDDKLTRAMLVTVLYRLEGEPATNRSIPFADVDMGAYYAGAVSWAKQNGIVNGVSETEFAPNDNITREQIAAIMHRYAQYKEYDVSVGENTNILSYNDYSSISEYAIGSMQWAVGSGFIKGKSESTLNPLDNATRAEAAAILHRFIEANK